MISTVSCHFAFSTSASLASDFALDKETLSSATCRVFSSSSRCNSFSRRLPSAYLLLLRPRAGDVCRLCRVASRETETRHDGATALRLLFCPRRRCEPERDRERERGMMRGKSCHWKGDSSNQARGSQEPASIPDIHASTDVTHDKQTHELHIPRSESQTCFLRTTNRLAQEAIP